MRRICARSDRRPSCVFQRRRRGPAARARRRPPDARADASTASCAAPTSSAIRRPASAGPATPEKLYFDWRKPGEKESSTYVVGRDGGEPRKLSDDEAKNAPPANGRWDKARSASCSSTRGDIVICRRDSRHAPPDHAGRPAARASPRWARNDTHVTYVRDGNLFIVPVDGWRRQPLVTQLTDVAPARRSRG